MNEREKDSEKLKMNPVETDTADFDPSDDKSLRLCTKNVNGQMYLVMAPENENSVLSDVSLEADTANSVISDVSMEIDTADEEDSDISVVLLNDYKSNENNVSDHRFLNQALTVPSSTISTSTPVVLPTISPSVLTFPSNNSNIISLLPSGLGRNVSVSGNSSLNATVSFPVDSIPFLTTNLKKVTEIQPISALAPSSHSLSTKSGPIILIPRAINTNSGIHAIKSGFVNSENPPVVNKLFHADGSMDSSSTCKVSVPISSPTGKKFTVDVNKTTTSAMLPKNLIVKSSQPLSQTNLKNILYSFSTILNAASQTSTEASGNVASKGPHTIVLNGTSTVYSASEPNMSSCVSGSTLNMFSPKSTSAATSTLAKTTIKTENQPKISLPVTNLPKKVFVVPVSLPSNNSQIVHLSMVSNSQVTPVSSPLTSFKYMLNPSSVAPIQQSSQSPAVIVKPTFTLASQTTTTMSTTSSAFPLQTLPLGSVPNNNNQIPSQMTPCVLLSTVVDQTSPAVTTDEKTILHNGYVSSNYCQAVKSSNSPVFAIVPPIQSNNSKETVINSSESILSNGVTTTPRTSTTNLAVLEDFESRKSSHAITETTSSYNLNKGIFTIPKFNSTADGSCMTKTQQMPVTSSQQIMSTNIYTSVAADKTSHLILPANTSDGRNSPAERTTTIEPNVQEVSSSASPSTTVIVTTAKNLMDSVPESKDSVKDSSSTNLTATMKNTLNLTKTKKLIPRPLAPKTEISAVNSSTLINPLSHIAPSTSEKDSNSLASTFDSSKIKQTSSVSLPLSNSTTSVSNSSNFSKPMVFIGPINPEDLLNLAKHIPSAAQSVFQNSPKTSSESVKIIHPNDIYKAKSNTNLPRAPSSTPKNIILIPPASLPDQSKIVPLVTTAKSKISNSLFPTTSTDQKQNTNNVKGLPLLYTSAGIANLQSAPTVLQASNYNNNARQVAKRVHNNVPIIFSPSPKSSSSDPLTFNLTSKVGSTSIYSQSHLKASPAAVSTINSIISKLQQHQQQQQQVSSVNISPMIKIKQELPDSTVNVAPVVSVANSQENVTANPLVRLASFSNNQVNLKLGNFSNASDALVKPVSTRVVNYITDPKAAMPQFVKLTKIVDNVNKMIQPPASVTQPNQPEQLFFKVQQPETPVMQVVDPSQQCILPDTGENTQNVKSTTTLTSNILIPSTSTLVLPSQLTNSKTSNALHISLNNSSMIPASTVVADGQSNLGNLKSICQKDDESPMTLKIDSIFSLRDNSNFTINTPTDNWKIKSEEEPTNDHLKPVVSSLTDTKPVVTSWTTSKSVISPVTTSKVLFSSVTTPKPVFTSFTISKPMVSSMTTLKPMVTSMTTSKPVVSSITTPNVMLTALSTSKPMVTSLIDSKPVVPSLTTSTPVVTTLTNFQPLVSIFPRPQSMVSIIPNTSRPIISLFTNSQHTHSSLINPKPIVSFATSKPIISSVTPTTSQIFLPSNLQSTNSTKTLCEVNSTETLCEVNSTETLCEVNSTETLCEVHSTETPNKVNSTNTPDKVNFTETLDKVNSTQTCHGEISTQTDYGENSTQTNYGENFSQTDFEVNSSQTDSEVNLKQPAYEINSTQPTYEIKSPQTTRTAEEELAFWAADKTWTGTGANSIQTAYGANSIQTAFAVNSKFSGNMTNSEENVSHEAFKSNLIFKIVQLNKPFSSKPPVSNSYRQYSYLNPKPIKPKTLLDNPNMVKLIKMQNLSSKLQRENKYLDMKLVKNTEQFVKSKKKTRIKIDKFTLSKFPLKQCFVLLPKLHMPDGQKSANVRKLGEKILDSIRCRTTCKNITQALRFHKKLASQTGSKMSFKYLNTPVNTNDTGINNFKQNVVNPPKIFKISPNSLNPLILPRITSLQPNQRLLMMQVNGKNVLVPVMNKLQHPQTLVLNKDHTVQTSIPTTLSSVGNMAIRTSISGQSLKTGSRFVNIAPNVVSVTPNWGSLANSTSLLNVSNPKPAEPVTPDTSLEDNDDDVNSCLQLACGIIETNTLKRKLCDSRRESQKKKDIFEMNNKKSKNYISSMLNI